MFEEANINSKIKKIADKVKSVLNFIKNRLKGLIPILKTIGIMWAALWGLSKLAALAKALGAAGLSGALTTAATALKGFLIGFAIGGIVSYIANIKAADNGTKELGYAITGAIVVFGWTGYCNRRNDWFNWTFVCRDRACRWCYCWVSGSARTIIN